MFCIVTTSVRLHSFTSVFSSWSAPLQHWCVFLFSPIIRFSYKPGPKVNMNLQIGGEVKKILVTHHPTSLKTSGQNKFLSCEFISV